MFTNHNASCNLSNQLDKHEPAGRFPNMKKKTKKKPPQQRANKKDKCHMSGMLKRTTEVNAFKNFRIPFSIQLGVLLNQLYTDPKDFPKIHPPVALSKKFEAETSRNLFTVSYRSCQKMMT